MMENKREELTGDFHDLVGRDSSVGLATRYGLDDPGIESRWWGRDFPQPSRPALGPNQLPIGVKRTGRDLTTHSHLAPRLKIE